LVSAAIKFSTLDSYETKTSQKSIIKFSSIATTFKSWGCSDTAYRALAQFQPNFATFGLKP
jgi:hypothetical protein